MSRTREPSLNELLKRVSRAFYLSLRVLPGKVRAPLALAYLLARAADTIADTRRVDPDRRLASLLALRARLASNDSGPLPSELMQLAAGQDDAHEGRLLSNLPRLMAALDDLAAPDADSVRRIVVRLTEGMEQDLRRFPDERSGRVTALADAEELDRYTYLVAGCVGEFWTEITIRHTPALADWDGERMARLGIDLGKALQRTNILRDLATDLRNGRCYLPVDPRELLDARQEERARPLLLESIAETIALYRSGELYLLAIPRRCIRLRLAVLWPQLMGLATLARLAHSRSWLDPQRPVKVSRGWVYAMIARSLVSVGSNAALSAWIARLRDSSSLGLN